MSDIITRCHILIVLYRALNIIQAVLNHVITQIWFIVVLQQSSNFTFHIFCLNLYFIGAIFDYIWCDILDKIKEYHLFSMDVVKGD
jgi:hypothetical protein